MTETEQLKDVLDRIDRRLNRAAARELRESLPEDLQLFTREQIMEIFQIGITKFYELKLPKYVHGRVFRYRLSDLPDHVRQHMRTPDGRPLEKRPMRKRPETKVAA